MAATPEIKTRILSIYEIRKQVEKQLPSELKEVFLNQLKVFLDVLERNNELRSRSAEGRKDFEREKEVLRFIIAHFIYSRNQRIKERSYPHVERAKKIKQELFGGEVPRLMLCIDGRVLSVLFAGLHSNSIRLPAGDSEDFVSGPEGKIVLPESSSLGKMLIQTLKELKQENTLYEVLDSHGGCAARNAASEEEHGVESEDRGRWDDVVKKKSNALAMSEMAERKFKGEKHIKTIQTSFDVDTGYLYMGLERVEALKHKIVYDSKKGRGSYTSDNLKTLAKQGVVISTELIVKNSNVKDIFKRYDFPDGIDYENNFPNSTSKFWQNLKRMKNELFPIFQDLVNKLYPDIHSAELQKRSMLLLANAYNTYLIRKAHKGKWPYNVHTESVMVATLREDGPFGRVHPFVINPDDRYLGRYIRLASGLIRKNRKAGNMSEIEKKLIELIYGNFEEYSRAPIPLVRYARVKDKISDEVITQITRINWNDLVDQKWMSMSDAEFTSYLNENKRLSSEVVVQAILELRRMAINTYRSSGMCEQYFKNNITPIWMLTGPDKHIFSIIPFNLPGLPAEMI